MYKLLIADDEALEREVLHYFVEQSNLEIDTIIECVNGTDAVKKVIMEKPDIILLDINMPGLNGLEAMERIRMANHRCKVIFSTAFNYFEYAVKALQLGAMDFIVKPVNKELLVSVLNKAIDQLDMEYQLESQSQRMKTMMELMGNHIIGELISGNITEEVLYYLETMGVCPECCSGNCFCIRVDDDYGKDQMKQVTQAVNRELTLMGFSVLIHWKNTTITLIIINDRAMESESVYNTMKDVISAIIKKHAINCVMGIGSPFNEFGQIEISYNHARAMVGDVEGLDEEVEIPVEDVPENIKKICDYIEHNYFKKIKLDDISQMVGYSKYHLNRLFKQHMGTTIGDYLIRIRINRGRELLKEGTYSIKQISDMIGYSDPNYFTWTFTKIEGVSPAKYRYNSN